MLLGVSEYRCTNWVYTQCVLSELCSGDMSCMNSHMTVFMFILLLLFVFAEVWSYSQWDLGG